MEKSALVQQDEEQGGMMAMILSIDWRYQVLCETHFHNITFTLSVFMSDLGLESWSNLHGQLVPVPAVVLYLLHPRQLQLLLLRRSPD